MNKKKWLQSCLVFLITLAEISICAGELVSKSIEKNGNSSTSHEEKKEKETKEDSVIITNHKGMIGGKEIEYKAAAGTISITDPESSAKGKIFFIAYTKESSQSKNERPITFCFNGGPGSSSVWLHMGAFGPKRVFFEGKGHAFPPYSLEDNDFSLLEVSDLVFIDPISTGYSRAEIKDEAKKFHGVDADVASIADFIRLYLTKNNRWDSPKYLAGESYGTTRASALASYLHDEHYIYCNGIILISSILNFQTINDHQNGNDLPYILYLPTYTKTAAYYRQIAPDLIKNLDETMKEVERFALNEYALALMKGDSLDQKTRLEIINKLATYTGLSKDFIDRANLRINNLRFAKELLRNKKRTIGRFDSRYEGIDSNGCGEYFEYDPSLDAVAGAFTATFNEYVRKELLWETDEEYKILTSVGAWNYNKATNQYLNVGEKLREVMTRNRALKVFVASGYYDLATPYFATDYTFDHLNLDPSLKFHVTKKYYEGGHMMFVEKSNLEQLSRDLKEFFN